MFKNIVFDVECVNTNFNVRTFLKWLHQLAVENVDYDILSSLPSTDIVSNFDSKVKVGESATVMLKPLDNIHYDISSPGSGLRLIDEKDGILTFRARKESENDLTVIIVDKNTLLTNSKKLKIQVE